MASGQPPVQTFVLRVSIHCHGCKKKVRKVLRGIEGVQEVKVDAQQHKVMVTGTVDAQTLIQRLQKSGKQALQWQHLHASPSKGPEPAPAAQAPPAEDGGKKDAPADKKPEEPVKEPQVESAEKKPEQEQAAPEKKPETAEKEAQPEKKAEKEEAKPSDEAKKDGGDGEAAAEVKKAKGAEPANQAPAPAKEAGNGEAEAKEKKQSKPKDVAAAAPAPAVERSLPRHNMAQQEYSPYHAPQPVMSYSMAQPRQSVSYYAPQPEQAYSSSMNMAQPQTAYPSSMNSNTTQQAYSQQTQPMQQWSPSYLYMPYPHASPESYYQDYYTSPPGTHAPAPPPPPPLQDSYRLFDDENPNSCSVM